MSSLEALPITILALAGLAISAIMTLVYYGVVSPQAAWLAVFCSPGEKSCGTVLGTRYARVFGLPNSLFGLGYYAALLAVVGGAWRVGSWVPVTCLVVALGTVSLGIYLVYALRVVLRMPCRLCYAAHAINVALAVALAVWVFRPA